MNKQLRVLLIEDSAVAEEMILAILRGHGYDTVSKRVYTAEAAEALLDNEIWDSRKDFP